MGFIDSYKHLEKLCGEVFNNSRGISSYIDEMGNIPRGVYYVNGWGEDLKKLKHYRWMRNKIAHDPCCTEENMCQPEDELWIDEFYSRIMNQTDPLALYHKATQSRSITKTTSEHTYPNGHIQPTQNNIGCATMMFIAVLIVVGIVLLSQFV